MDNNIIDKRNWRTGYFIQSSKTAHWPQRQIDLTNEDENRIVFANFKEEDKGKSRKRICTCENKEDAAFIVKACNEYDKLKEQIGLTEIELSHKNTLLASCENALEKSYDKNKELLEALKEMCEVQGNGMGREMNAYNNAKEAIKKHSPIN